MNPTLTQQATLLIAQARAAGQMPLVFYMNSNTVRMVIEEATTVTQKRQSALGRLIDRLRGRKTPERMERLLGVTVVENPTLSDGIIGLQAAVTQPQVPMSGKMGDVAGGLANNGPQPAQEMPNALNPNAAMPEFEKRERVEPTEDGNPKLADFVSANERVTPTDVLIKAMGDIDRITRVVVIRVYDNGDVDMSLNASALETVGILEKARVWLMMRG